MAIVRHFTEQPPHPPAAAGGWTLLRPYNPRITDWQGNDPVGATSSVATNGELHAAVIQALNRPA